MCCQTSQVKTFLWHHNEHRMEKEMNQCVGDQAGGLGMRRARGWRCMEVYNLNSKPAYTGNKSVCG
jgi:hypothetical protein